VENEKMSTAGSAVLDLDVIPIAAENSGSVGTVAEVKPISYPRVPRLTGHATSDAIFELHVPIAKYSHFKLEIEKYLRASGPEIHRLRSKLSKEWKDFTILEQSQIIGSVKPLSGNMADAATDLFAHADPNAIFYKFSEALRSDSEDDIAVLGAALTRSALPEKEKLGVIVEAMSRAPSAAVQEILVTEIGTLARRGMRTAKVFLQNLVVTTKSPLLKAVISDQLSDL
jgi:hypothetical protein